MRNKSYVRRRNIQINLIITMFLLSTNRNAMFQYLQKQYRCTTLFKNVKTSCESFVFFQSLGTGIYELFVMRMCFLQICFVIFFQIWNVQLFIWSNLTRGGDPMQLHSKILRRYHPGFEFHQLYLKMAWKLDSFAH